MPLSSCQRGRMPALTVSTMTLQTDVLSGVDPVIITKYSFSDVSTRRGSKFIGGKINYCCHLLT